MIAVVAEPQGNVDVSLPSVPTPEHVFVDSCTDLEAWFPGLLEAPRVALDSETTGLDVFEHRLATVQLAARGLPVVVVDLRRIDPRALEPLFDGQRDIVIFNAEFDLSFLLCYLVDIDHIRVVDPHLNELILDAAAEPFRRNGHYRLQSIVERRLG